LLTEGEGGLDIPSGGQRVDAGVAVRSSPEGQRALGSPSYAPLPQMLKEMVRTTVTLTSGGRMLHQGSRKTSSS
jgi:hypothetical protein